MTSSADARLAALRERVGLDPHDSEAWLELALAEGRAGNPAAAAAAFEASLAWSTAALAEVEALAREHGGHGGHAVLGDPRRRLPGPLAPAGPMTLPLQPPSAAAATFASPDGQRLAALGSFELSVFEAPLWREVCRIPHPHVQVRVGWLGPDSLAWVSTTERGSSLWVAPEIGRARWTEQKLGAPRPLGGVVAGRWRAQLREGDEGRVVDLVETSGRRAGRVDWRWGQPLPDLASTVAGPGGVLVAVPARLTTGGGYETALLVFDPAGQPVDHRVVPSIVQVLAWTEAGVVRLAAERLRPDRAQPVLVQASAAPLEEARVQHELDRAHGERCTGVAPDGAIVLSDREHARWVATADGAPLGRLALRPWQEARPLGRDRLVLAHPGGFDVVARPDAAGAGGRGAAPGRARPDAPEAGQPGAALRRSPSSTGPWLPHRHGLAPVHALGVSPDGATLVAHHQDGRLRVLDRRRGALVAEVDGPRPPAHAGWADSIEPGVEFSADGTRVAVCSLAGLAIHETEEWTRVGEAPLTECRRVTRAQPVSTALHPRGTEVLVGGPRGQLARLDARDGRELARFQAFDTLAWILDCCYRADGEAVAAVASGRPDLREWPLEGGEPSRTWSPRQGRRPDRWRLVARGAGYRAWAGWTGPLEMDGEGGEVQPGWKARSPTAPHSHTRHPLELEAGGGRVVATLEVRPAEVVVVDLEQRRTSWPVRLRWEGRARPTLALAPGEDLLLVGEGDGVRAVPLRYS